MIISYTEEDSDMGISRLIALITSSRSDLSGMARRPESLGQPNEYTQLVEQIITNPF